MNTIERQLRDFITGLGSTPTRANIIVGPAGLASLTLAASAISSAQLRLRTSNLSAFNSNGSLPLLVYLQGNASEVYGSLYVVPSGQGNIFFDWSANPLLIGQNKGFGLFPLGSSTASLQASLTSYYTTEAI